MRSPRRLLLGGAVALAAILVPAAAATAHPLGNLTVNAALDVVVHADSVDVTYVQDLAELPTVQARQQFAPAGGAQAWAAQRCDRLAAGVTVAGRAPGVDGAATIAFPPGQGGLDTLRLTCPLRLERALTTSAAIDVVDANDTDRIGWREIVVRADGATIVSSDVPASSPSALLTAYPADVSSPSRVLRAHVVARPGGAVAAGAPGAGAPAAAATKPQARGADALTQRMNRLVSGHRLSAPLAALAVALAFVLGGLHALAPGHGKTVMAATVVARRGAAARQVLTIGATVAATHTTGVLLLGVAIWTSQAVAPDRVLPWLTLASGTLLVATGVALLVRRRRLGPGHHHHGTGHAHPHAHDAHDHHHDHDAHDHDAHDHDRAPAGSSPLSRRWLVTMGLAGGMVPTPSALVVLLGAAALGRTWFGVLLVAVYGVGMAGTLMAAGVALVRLQGWLEHHWYGTRWLAVTLRLAPVVTAVALMGGGISLAVRSLSGV